MVTRISGLASGMDIDSMVKKLMTAESIPLTKMNQQKQLMEWKRENYREVSTKLVTFLQDKITKLSSATVLNAQKANVTGNTSAVSAVASSSASGVIDIKVERLASASIAVTESGTWTNRDASTTTLQDLGIATGQVQIGNATIDVSEGDTIEAFVSKINNNKTAGVTAIYDAAGGLSLTSKATGTSSALQIDPAILSKFNLTSTPGQDAKAVINGLTVSKSSNTFDVNGVMLTLNSTTPTDTTRITVSKDTDKVVEAVQSFVDAYNEVLSTLNSKVSEERYKKYTPLSTEERAAMSDEEAKLWTDKAKSGMLKNDSILRQTISDMRTAILQGVDIGRTVEVTNADGTTSTVNKPLMLTELGITTGTYQTNGKLELDTDKLKAALEKDPDIVTDFFSTNYSTSFADNTYKQSDGLLAKMRKITNVSLQQMAQTAGTSQVSKDLTSTFLANSTMGEALNALERRISDMTRKLNTIETNYFKKFTAMETAINKYNSTSSSLAGL
ncbi:flagellar filament capping protein FliD [Paenibacillus illinoisensis]|uniref:flagellar filament capping protein FliD n=1 Tax=Paenibacillus illinoisensis TaxID=59845 RepID=UPI001C8EBCF8|nr:flagellar filament capping protein FliD [Paenibacillus illinoisensis]MBY0220433.1 flagellar filament capping protein FliD [Paenibacillus illinoisensis]